MSWILIASSFNSTCLRSTQPKFKDGVAARVTVDADVDVNDDEHDNDGDDPADAHHLEARSRLGLWFVEA